MKLESSVSAVVTGGASGLGAATARRLAARGVKVALFDLNAEAGEALARDLGGVFCRVDVTSDEQVDAARGLGGEKLSIPDDGRANSSHGAPDREEQWCHPVRGAAVMQHPSNQRRTGSGGADRGLDRRSASSRSAISHCRRPRSRRSERRPRSRNQRRASSQAVRQCSRLQRPATPSAGAPTATSAAVGPSIQMAAAVTSSTSQSA